MRQLTDADFDATIGQNDKITLVDFSSPGCGPCKLQRPVLESFGAQHPELQVAELDIASSPKTANALKIHAVPTLMLFRGGEPIARARGLQTMRKLESLLRRALEDGV